MLLLVFTFVNADFVEDHNKKIDRILTEAKAFEKDMEEMDKMNKEDFGNFNLVCEAFFTAAGHKLQLGGKLDKADLKKEATEAYKKADTFYTYVLKNCELSNRAAKRIHNLITYQ